MVLRELNQYIRGLKPSFYRYPQKTVRTIAFTDSSFTGSATESFTGDRAIAKTNGNPDPARHETALEQPLETTLETTLETATDIETLRQLLFGDSVKETVNTALSPEAVSRVLPKALARAGYQENELTRALIPTIEDAVKESARTDENILAEALFPVIGPATRKSISSAIDGLLQSLNQTLEYSVSAKSLHWRWEAFKTGKTFAEVVMLRTLVYQVEQVLLIHKETGLLLAHRVDEATEAQDPDLVSAMLAAIESFIQDSFEVSKGETLEAMELGDLNVWIEEGPHAILACVIGGNAPMELRRLLRTSQEKIQQLFGEALAAFDGDATAVEGSQPYLDDCLHFRFAGQSTDEEKRVPISDRQKAILWAIALIVVLVIGFKTVGGYQEQQQWNGYIAAIEQQPGLVIISQRKQGKKHILNGLRDPMAVDPTQKLSELRIDPQRVQMNWHPYWSLAPSLAGERMQVLLDPPTTVTMNLDERRMLHLSGQASERWIDKARQLSQELFGAVVWQDDGLVSDERVELGKVRSRIESRKILFAPQAATLRGQYRSLLSRQAADIKTLIQQSEALNAATKIAIRGYGGRRGGAFIEVGLGQVRANYVKSFLVRQGISAALIEAKSIAKSEDNPSGNQFDGRPVPNQNALSDAVVFKVDFNQ